MIGLNISYIKFVVLTEKWAKFFAQYNQKRKKLLLCIGQRWLYENHMKISITIYTNIGK